MEATMAKRKPARRYFLDQPPEFPSAVTFEEPGEASRD